MMGALAVFTIPTTRAVKILTASCISLLLGVMLIVGVNVLTKGLDPAPLLILGLVSAVPMLLAYAYTPVAAELRGSCLAIRRALAPPVVIDYSSVEEVIYVGEVRGLARVFAVGGLFGVYGRFSATVLGRTMDVYTRGARRTAC